MKLDDIIPTDSPVTCTLMCLIWACSCLAFFNRRLFFRFILHPYTIVRQRQYYRLLTGDMVSNDPLHLGLNELMLCFFGGKLEEELNRRSGHGALCFLFVYLCSWFCGVACMTWRYQDDFEYSSAGASGSILGCAVSFMILVPEKIAFYVPGIGGVKNKYDALLLIGFLIFYQRKTQNPTVSHELHFFGAVGGMIAAFLIVYLKLA